MLIILEGPRNSGKSTAVEEIQKALGGKAYTIKFQRTAHPPLFMTEFLSKHYLALIDSRSICVLDRFHLTEFVMRTVDKKVSEEILYTSTHMIDIMLKQIGAVTYFIDTKPEIRKERFKLRDEFHRKPELGGTMKEIDEAWETALKHFHRSDVRIFPGNTMEDIEKLVVDVLKYKVGGKRVETLIPLRPPVIQIPELEVA